MWTNAPTSYVWNVGEPSDPTRGKTNPVAVGPEPHLSDESLENLKNRVRNLSMQEDPRQLVRDLQRDRAERKKL